MLMKKKWDKTLKIFAVLLIAVGTWFFNGNLFANNHMIKLRFQTGNVETKTVKITMQSTKNTVVQEELDVTEKDEEGDFYYSMNLEEGTTYKVTAVSIDQQPVDMSGFDAEFGLLHDTLTLTTESNRITFTNEEITYLLNDKPEVEKTIIEPKAAVAGNVKTVSDELTQRITEFAPDFTALDWKDANLSTGDIFGSATDQCVFTFGDFKVLQGSEIIGMASIGGALDNTGSKPMSQIGDTPGAGNGEAPSWSKHHINYIIGNNVLGGFKGGIHGWLASSLENTGLTETDTLFRESVGDTPVSYKNTYIYGAYSINDTQTVADKITQYFASAKANLNTKSITYMENPLGSVGTVVQENWGLTTFTGKDQNFNVFNLSSAQFNAMKEIVIDVPLNSYVQINITDNGELTFIATSTTSNVLTGNLDTRIDAAGTTPDVDNMDACSHIFWNMPNTKKFTTKQLFCGSILGPNVDLFVEGPSTNGSIIVNSYTLNNPGGEAHNYPFKYQKNTPTPTIDISISGTKELSGKTWSGETFTIELQDDKGTVLETKEVNKDNKEFKFTKQFTDYDIQTTPYHYVVKEKASNLNSVKDDTKQYDVYVKVLNGGNDSLSIEMSLDGINYTTTSDLVLGDDSASFTNTYFTGSVELSKTLDGKAFSGDSEAEFSLYQYTSTEAALNEAGNQLIGSYTTTKGKLNVKDLEEGKYFFVETKAPDGYELSEKLYTFEITADNYTTVKEIKADNYQKYGLSIKGSKMLEGRNITDRDNFMVELVANNVVIKNFLINTNGYFQIDLSNMDVGEYSYIIREKQPADGNTADGVTYDTKEYKLDIKVSVDAAGKASAIVKLDDMDYTVKDGVIQLQDETTPAFKNTYTATGNLSISGIKTLQGRDWSATDSFTIQFLNDDGTLINEKEIKKDDTSFSFTQDYTLADVGKTYHYQVKEKNTKANSIINDTKVYELYVKISDALDGSLNIETSNDGITYKKGNNVTLGNKAFINTYFTGSVELSKTLDGKAFSGDSEAEFSLYQYTSTEAALNEAGNQLIGSYTTIKGKLNVKDLEEGKYFFVETKAPDGYELSEKLYTFEITADNYATVKEIKADNHQKASLSLHGSKHLEGRDISDDDQFIVELLNKNDRSVVKTAQIAVNGEFTISLPSLSEGNYEYILHEKQPTVGHVEDGITFDTAEYDINIHVTKDVTGKPSTEIFINGVKKEIQDGKVRVSTGATFTNQYQSKGTLSIQGGKTLEGRDWKPTDAFLVEFYEASSNTLLSSQTLTATNKNFTFLRNYNLDDTGKTYHYVIRERSTGAHSILYDDTLYHLYVKVQDDANGSLKLETSLDNTSFIAGNSVDLGNRAFVNTYVNGSVDLTKTLDGEAFHGNSEAEFALYQYAEGIPSMENDKKTQVGVYATSNGKLHVDKLETGTFFFIETKAPKGYVLSAKVIPFEITVDNYKTAIQVKADNQKKASLTLQGTKAMIGRDLTDDDHFQVELTDQSGAVLQSTNIQSDGTFSFSLNALAEGKHIFNIREKQPNTTDTKGISYDKKVYVIEINVEQNIPKVKVNNAFVEVKDGNVQLSEQATFTNTYTAKGSSHIHGEKVLKGREWKPQDTFTIQLFDEKGVCIETQHVHKDATKFSFERNYTLADAGKTFHYMVREKKEAASSILYDTKQYDIYIRVVDDGKGTLSIESSRDGITFTGNADVDLGNQAFVNQYFTGSAEIVKTLDGEDFHGDSEAVFALYSYDGKDASLDNLNKQLIDTYTTENGHIRVSDLEEGFYFFVEQSAPHGYSLSDDIYAFEIRADNYANSNVISVDNVKLAKGTIAIHKANADDLNQALHKAVYAIYAHASCSKQDLLSKLVTDEKGYAESTMQFDAGTYYIREYEAPNGYTLDETVYSITIDENGNPSIPVLKVADAPTRVLISKVKEDNVPLAGAHLQIKDAHGNIVEQWISDGSIHKLIGRLNAGETYTLEETQAPKGYTPSKPITFEVPLYGDVEKKVNVVNIAIIQPEKPIEPQNPGTGDTENLSHYIAFFAGSGGILALLLVAKKRLIKKSNT